MYTLILAFFTSFIISFVGSLQPGPVNLAVLSSSIQKKYKHALWVSVGGSWPEFAFCFIALKAAQLVTHAKQYFDYYQIIITITFYVLGIYLWFSKSNKVLKTSNKNGVLLGSILAILNPQLILFWTVVISYIHINQIQNLNLFNEISTQLFFAFGASIGALTLHLLLIYLCKNYIQISVQKIFKHANKTISIIFVILAIIQTINIIY